MAKKPVSDQMELFEDGGFKDQGNTKDPISNNPVPVGSTKKEVRDDIPANLSEGEFVLPADVVRYHGLEKIMGFRDQAKQGLEKMENMGQMGNSDQATIPDGVPFQQMAEGGAVPVPTIQQPKVVAQNQVPGVQYVAPTTQAVRPSIYSYNQQQPQMPQVTVPTQPSVTVPTRLDYQTPVYRQSTSPTETPKFSNLLGTQFGQLQESVTKRYVNDAGEEMYIPFVNGQPIYPIPNGFREEKETTKIEEDKTKQGNQQFDDRELSNEATGDSSPMDGSQTQDYKVAMQLSEAEAKARGTTGILGKLIDDYKKISSILPGKIIVDSVLNKINPDRPFSQGPVSDIYGDDYITDANQKEIYAIQSGYTSLDAMTKQYGVEPSFKFGTKPGDVSVVTGKPYNYAGQSEQSDGSVAFASWDDWTNSLAASSKTGWYGGSMTEAQIENYTSPNLPNGQPNPNYNKNWNRSKVDAYMKEINKTYSKEDDDKDKSKVTTTTKSKALTSKQIEDLQLVPTPRNKAFTPDNIIGRPTPSVNLTATGADSKGSKFKAKTYMDNATLLDGSGASTGEGSSLSDSSSSFDTSSFTGSDDYGDSGSDAGYGDVSADVGGWTAKGGFINKRTMTMSKTPPNKKKRGGLASRR